MGIPRADDILLYLPEDLLAEWQEYFAIEDSEVKYAYAIAKLASYIPRFSKTAQSIKIEDFMASASRRRKRDRKPMTSQQFSAFINSYGKV